MRRMSLRVVRQREQEGSRRGVEVAAVFAIES